MKIKEKKMTTQILKWKILQMFKQENSLFEEDHSILN